MCSSIMALHNKWYPAAEDTIIPWNATYSFPTEANKCEKSIPRIQPKTGSSFGPGDLFRIEFPASGYINPLNTFLTFDLTMTYSGSLSGVYPIARFQNNVASIFERITLYYGSNVIEDIRGYNVIVRALTEWTATNQMVHDNSSITEGIGGVVIGSSGSGASQGLVNVRQNYIQGVDLSTATTDANFSAGDGAGYVPNTAANNQTNGLCTRRYCINLALGIFTQDKLLPVKYMAAQLGLEFTLATAASCMFVQIGGTTATNWGYRISNIAMLPEVLQFDSSYDVEFLKGLEGDGVPIKFCSWHRFVFPTANSSVANLIIQEKSRSVKSIFMIQRRAPENIQSDSGAFFYDTSATANSLIDYQYRIGDRYYPGRPVQCTGIGGNISNGGAEAYMELQKAMNTMGDYRLSPPVNSNRWAVPVATGNITLTGSGLATPYNELDYTCNIASWSTTGCPSYQDISKAINTTGNCFGGNLGSNCFTMALSLETSNGVEISGLNAEQQSDISLIANWSAGQQSAFIFEVFTYYDAMLILRSGNNMDLVQ